MTAALLRLGCLVAVLGLGLAALAATKHISPPPPTAVPVVKKTLPYLIATDHTGSLVNWSAGQVEVVGVGLTQGNDALTQWRARTNAMVVLVEEAKLALAKVRLDGTTTLKPVLEKAEFQEQAKGFVGNITVVDEIWNKKKGTYAVVGTIPLFGAQGLVTLGAKALPPFSALELKEDLLVITAPIPRGYTPQHAAAPYTGIIINGDDALLTPCLFPHIMRFDGKELWGPAAVAGDNLTRGAVRYAPNLETALDKKAAGERPLVLSAIGNAQGSYPIVNLDDCYLVLTQQKATHIFDNLPIVITLGLRR